MHWSGGCRARRADRSLPSLPATAPMAPGVDGDDDGDVIDSVTVSTLADPALGGDPVFFAELINIFEKETPGAIATLHAAASNGESESLALAAHKLKGSSRYLGANRVSSLCQQIETIGISGTMAGAGELVVHLAEQITVAINRLEEEEGRWNSSEC